jgi:hypothetical protein
MRPTGATEAWGNGMPADAPLGLAPADLQTLIQTLQQLVVTGGSIVQAIVDPSAVPRNAVAQRLSGGSAKGASGVPPSLTDALQHGAARTVPSVGDAPPEGFWVVNIPGVGPRAIPYYPVPGR